MTFPRLLSAIFVLGCGGSHVYDLDAWALDDATLDDAEDLQPNDGSLDWYAVGQDADVPDVMLADGGGPFWCHACWCDGKTHYCDYSSNGPPPDEPLPDANAPDCSDASRCFPFPPPCAKTPSCACLFQALNMPCPDIWECYASTTGDGIIEACSLP